MGAWGVITAFTPAIKINIYKEDRQVKKKG
jgi:hypothetical protein